MGTIAEKLPSHVSIGPVALPANPERRSASTGYHRTFQLTGAWSPCLLQRVRVHIRYHCGRQLCADYRQTYYEFFRFDHPTALLIDTHDFDLVRDGWRQEVITGLMSKHHASGRSPLPGEARLSVRKQFVVASGLVADDQAREISDGAHFGLLANGPEGPSRTALQIARGDGTMYTMRDLAPCPAGYPVAGHGTFTGSHGFRAFEFYRYDFTQLRGRLTDRGGYSPHTTGIHHA